MSTRTTAPRISTIVYGRESIGPRVTYLLDPDGGGTRRDVAESIVLGRWRRRRRDGVTFSGARLAPSLWRALPMALGHDVSMWCTLDESALAVRITAARSALRQQHYTLPSAAIVHTLLAVCGTARLQQLVTRHADPARWAQPGVPDLFLFMRDATGRVMSPRFVEVKRPDEPVRAGQVEEIAFLQSIGLNARVLRLTERGDGRKQGTARKRGTARKGGTARRTTVTPAREIAA
jgi:hypothetical protein